MKGLRILASLLLVAAFCMADDDETEKKKKMQAILEECGEEQGITKEDAEKIPDLICNGEELDKKFSCHTACFYQKLGVMEGSEILPEKVKSSIFEHMKSDEARAKVEGKLDACKAEVDGVADECDKAAAFTRCLFRDTELCNRGS